jgi:hypothetical protein
MGCIGSSVHKFYVSNCGGGKLVVGYLVDDRISLAINVDLNSTRHRVFKAILVRENQE